MPENANDLELGIIAAIERRSSQCSPAKFDERSVRCAVRLVSLTRKPYELAAVEHGSRSPSSIWSCRTRIKSASSAQPQKHHFGQEE
jgi:hypothetical protein